jgi:ADP-ribosylglycohydrolase
MLPKNYLEKAYAGVLGKIIGVYLGRPFEGWTNERIERELGEVWYYVNTRMAALNPAYAHPLIVTDDDISGTFTFLRALPDYGNTLALTPQQIGQTWLNYIIEKKTILWWGGLGNSTEHTAYLRLKHGIPAPHSGSIQTNGKVVAEQIGSQIFIDGWAMVAPGNPDLAVDLARRAASVSHDGEAIYGAQVIAAMEAQAFVEPNLDKLIDCAMSFIPKDSVIYKLINDLREWHSEIADWRAARKLLQKHYGYDQYGGNCHMVPNHGVIMLGLLYGQDKNAGQAFQKSLMITNTAGWDTDCNSANVGCLLGIKNGLAGIDAGPDWRGPVADRLYLPSADGGRAISDAVQETYRIVALGYALTNQKAPAPPKNSARFHFELPGSVQGFVAEQSSDCAALTVENALGHSELGRRSLALRYRNLAAGQCARAATATFVPPDSLNMKGYSLLAAPTLYSGQTVRARVQADEANTHSITCAIFASVYAAGDTLRRIYAPLQKLRAGQIKKMRWQLPDTAGQPIAQIGLELRGAARRETRLKGGETGSVYLDYVAWDGVPNVVFKRPQESSSAWRQAWVSGVDHYDPWWPEAYRILQDEGTGLLMTGTREWTDYAAETTLTPHLCARFGLVVRCQGMRRFYGLLFVADGQEGQRVQLVKALDGEIVLAQAALPWEFGKAYALRVQVRGNRLHAFVDGKLVLQAADTQRPLQDGGIALLVSDGRVATDEVRVGEV